jgi:3-phenylpropionate/trans-cinnamate dioxygenase ferredoxin component
VGRRYQRFPCVWGLGRCLYSARHRAAPPVDCRRRIDGSVLAVVGEKSAEVGRACYGKSECQKFCQAMLMADTALVKKFEVGLSVCQAGGKQMADFVKVAKTHEINPGQARLIEVKDKQIAVFNINGEFFAIDNTCTHEEASLAEGEISGHEVTCPLHGAKFDVRTGEVLGPPAYDDVSSYTVRVVGNDIEIDVA